MGRWLLVRHAESTWNQERRLQGQSDPPLSPQGQAQAQALRQRLKRFSIAHTYASDLTRAVQTAHIVLEGRSIPLTLTPALREFAFGPWEGKLYDVLTREDPIRFRQFMTGDPSFEPPPGGETRQQVLQRVGAFIAHVRQHHLQDDILIVSHGGCLRAVVVALLGLPVETLWRFRLAPASISVIEVDTHNARLVVWNDASHYLNGDLPRPGGPAA
ncbi:MAG: histidine phosphatase family protein [Dehalococcoidia bacterium]|nr:histidine phosphatase family protein [Dehalococcoidia bacterium]MDW8119587.1 histidine phosphatase family protein [Chloroflexota bacterium]